MNFWWVSQNQTYVKEFRGGYLWSPKLMKNGHRCQSYDNMTRVVPGDVVFSYADKSIVSIGIAITSAFDFDKPGDFGAAGDDWSVDGWRIDLDYHELDVELCPAKHLDSIVPLLPVKHSPIRANGVGNQAYLFEISNDLVELLIELSGSRARGVVSDERSVILRGREEEAIEEEIQLRPNLSSTEKLALTRSRRGQGLFRSRLEIVERMCRLTGTSDKRHLIASHIKPWAKATDEERLDGHNGLLLAPHVDHLFDRGYISFEENGQLLLSPQLDSKLVLSWGIRASRSEEFSPEQRHYLEFHRNYCFRQAASS